MKLSIITINYNNCEGLRKTIDSVIFQTWQDFEWIIVDGGSTDGSKELLEDTAHRLESQGWKTENFSLLSFNVEKWGNGTYPKTVSREVTSRTLLWTSEKDNGIYNAMNKGILMAEGEYCLFLNSGDIFFNNYVISQINLNLQETDFVVGRVEYYHNNKKQLSHNFVNTVFTACNLFERPFPHQATFIKTSLFTIYGKYNENYKIVSDHEFLLRTIVLGKATVSFTPVIVSIFDTEGISNSKISKVRQERQDMFAIVLSPYLIQDFNNSISIKQVRTHSISRFFYAILYRFNCLLK